MLSLFLRCPVRLVALARLCLNGGNGHGVNNVFGFATSREVVGRFVESLKNRSDGGRPGQSFRKLVTDVAGLKIRKDQHICAAT